MNVHERQKRNQFVERARNIWGVRPARAEELLSIEHRSSLRINRLTELRVSEILLRIEESGIKISPIPWCPDAYHLESDKSEVAASDLFQKGYVYLQNASSLAPPLALDPQVGDSVLDVCAAPGGKSAHIAALVGNRCELWLNDSSKPRLAKLAEVVEIFRVKIAGVTQYPGQYLTKHFDRQFDRILLDAQCSGEGMINLADPRALRFWSMSRIHKFSRLQEKMLTESFKLLRPGGTLVYSTCTLAPEEDEGPVDRLLRIFPEASLEPISLEIPNACPGLNIWEDKKFSPACAQAMRILPSTWMESFFLCKIRKSA